MRYVLTSRCSRRPLGHQFQQAEGCVFQWKENELTKLSIINIKMRPAPSKPGTGRFSI